MKQFNKRKLSVVVALLMCMILAFGSTFAYLTDTTSKINTVTIGKVDIDVVEDLWSQLPDTNSDGIPDIAEAVIPNQTVTKDPSIKNTGNNEAYVYLSVEVPNRNITSFNPDGTPANGGAAADTDLFNYEINDGWTLINTKSETGKTIYVYGYENKLAVGDETPTLFDSVTVVNTQEAQGLEETVQSIVINGYAIQADQSGDLLNAWTIINNQMDLGSAVLSNILLPGPEFNATIPASATKIVFTDAVAPVAAGTSDIMLLSDEELTETNAVTLTDVSAAHDMGVVSWYDETNTTYYVSTQRAGLDALINPNSSYMFSRKSNLKEFDFTSLDTKLSTDMSYMFYQSTGLETIDVSNFNTDNVKTMEYMFGSNSNGILMSFKSIVFGSKFNTSNVETFFAMFRNCRSVTELNVSDWNTSSAKNMQGMFNKCTSITEMDISKWDLSSCENISYIFAECHSLEKADCSGLDLGNIKIANSMFSNCAKLQYFSTKDWDTSSMEQIGFMFYGCKTFKKLDCEDWDVRRVQSFDHFMAHSQMEEYDVSKWEVTSACTNLNGIFHSTKETYIDVTGWDTSNVITFNQLCDGMSNLQKIDGLETWNTSNGVCFGEMFHGCGSLKEANLSSFDTRKANTGTQISTNGSLSYGLQDLFTGCGSLEKLILSENFTRFGNGEIGESYYANFPTPASGYWYNAETGQAYDPNEIPDLTAATYVSTQP